MRLIRRHIFFSFLLILSVTAIIQPLAAKDRSVLSFSAISGIRHGMVEEIVYYDKTLTTLLSRLDWEQKMSPFIGVKASVNIPYVSVSLAASLGFPIRSGQMEDFDWLNAGANKGPLTHYSSHNAFLDKDLAASARVTLLVVDTQSFSFGPIAGISYRNRLWRAEDGYGQYPPEKTGPYTPWHEDAKKEPFHGLVISYNQTIISPSVGLTMEWMTKGSWGITLSGSWLPYVSVDALDNHYLRGMQFRDIMDKGMGWNVEGTLGIPLGNGKNPKRLDVSVAYEHFALKGLGYNRAINTSAWNLDSNVGTTSSLWTIGIGFGF
ncbi:omptin family outer membrane protease [Parasphaerochaeta coccoides]|uniref:Uncharacterized protein n=1 Tax=Parasphaerochaeta coccoides (strain ATCC BAA-1237 / DSM 17374 / SPN1) TaxID=760011 RepID=F4GLT1_PARC1|nr:omptin family outer membrane protease [Parasphaerochaeta coccoides]AEC02475.1 hypothetical protein Spico_1266 [Parasphaerochaeta coccoides DSM 17374]